MLKILALDPGVTTGYAVGVIDDEGYMKVHCEQAIFTHLDFYDFIKLNHPEVIVCESFEFRKLAVGVNLYPVEMIGIVKYFVEEMERRHVAISLHMQPAATQGDKAYWTDDKLKDADVYEAGKEHGRSALKHLLYWYEFGPGYKHNKRGFGPWTEN